MPKFNKDVFECLIDKVIIGEVAEEGTINPYTIRGFSTAPSYISFYELYYSLIAK